MGNTKLMIRMGVILMMFLSLWCCRTPAGRTAGQVVDDSAISTIIKTRLFQDPYLSGLAISVQTFEGEVTLTGAVNSEYSRQRATALATAVDGVRRVNNLLVIKGGS